MINAKLAMKIAKCKMDGLVKSLGILLSVIAAKAGIQYSQIVINSLDSGSCRRTGVTTFYEFIKIEIKKC
jgi:hypothetical protein